MRVYKSEMSVEQYVKRHLERLFMNTKQSILGSVFYAIFGCVALGFLAGFAYAGESLAPPQIVIQQTSEQMKEVLRKEKMPLDAARINRYVDQILDPNVDFNRVSALVLGRHWKTANKDQKSRFKKEFRETLIRTYATAFTEFKNWAIRFKPLRMKPKDKKVVVRIEVLQPGSPPVAVSYRMVSKKDGWKAYDVIIEGISLVTNYRTTFQDEAQRSGSLDRVIERLAARNNRATNTAAKGES